jgi:hypothetical protein
MKVTVKVRGRSRSVRLDGACGEWSRRRSMMLPGVWVSLQNSDLSGPAWLVLSARSNAGANGTKIRVTVRSGGKRLLSRNFEAVWDRTPSERVYQGTDEFWNYCINEGGQAYSHRGRLYCVRPGFTTRFVALRR